MNVLVIDNIDSFVYNLVQYLGEEGANPIVFDNRASMREISDAVKKNRVERIVISPGPKRPEDAGVSNDVIKKFGPKMPLLGVCLGHECIGYVYGARIRRAKTLKHGKTSMVSHCCDGIFEGLANPFEAVRYHSLVLDDLSMPECLRICAISNDDKEVMAVEHRKHPIIGVQFHPESIMTRDGKQVIRNFLNLPF
jgi:anthranilate synthase/aminodeoxychorismate synthase-like glutamine amidotransferase